MNASTTNTNAATLTQILHLDSSAMGENSVTRELTAGIVAGLRAANPAVQVTYRDLNVEPIVHLSSDTLSGTDAVARADGERTMQQFLDADVLVIGAPMYNFAVPSTLKAWIDRIAIAGKTFRYTADGPEGLAGGKRVLVAMGSGGLHAGTPRDFVTPYLQTVFGFLGIDAVEFIRAEGVGLSPEHRSAALAAAHAQIAAASTPLAEAA